LTPTSCSAFLTLENLDFLMIASTFFIELIFSLFSKVIKNKEPPQN